MKKMSNDARIGLRFMLIFSFILFLLGILSGVLVTKAWGEDYGSLAIGGEKVEGFYVLIIEGHQQGCINCSVTYRKFVHSPEFASTLLWQYNSETNHWTSYSGKLLYITPKGKNVEVIAIPAIKFGQ